MHLEYSSFFDRGGSALPAKALPPLGFSLNSEPEDLECQILNVENRGRTRRVFAARVLLRQKSWVYPLKQIIDQPLRNPALGQKTTTGWGGYQDILGHRLCNSEEETEPPAAERCIQRIREQFFSVLRVLLFRGWNGHIR